MRLRRFRVRAFRCVHDSGDITVGDLAAFVGRNESGKTTILQALTLLNKDEMVSELDLCDEMIEELKSEIKLVEGEFDLNENENELIREKFPDLNIKKITIFRTNKNDEIQYDFGDLKFDQKKDTGPRSWKDCTESLLGFVETIPNHIRTQLDTKFFESNILKNKEALRTELTAFDNNIRDKAANIEQIISEWKKTYDKIVNSFENISVEGTKRMPVEQFLLDNLHPRFVWSLVFLTTQRHLLNVQHWLQVHVDVLMP